MITSTHLQHSEPSSPISSPIVYDILCPLLCPIIGYSSVDVFLIDVLSCVDLLFTSDIVLHHLLEYVMTTNHLCMLS